MSQQHCVESSNLSRDTMNKQELDSKIRYYQIWLIGDRCDGWEKASVQKQLSILIETKKKMKDHQ